MTETEWRNGYAILRGYDLHGDRVDATDKIGFKYKLVTEDGQTLLDLDRIVHVGPVERSASIPYVALFNVVGDEEPFAFFQPPPGAGRVGGYVTITRGQEVQP
jgi:hypothetical protein